MVRRLMAVVEHVVPCLLTAVPVPDMPTIGTSSPVRFHRLEVGWISGTDQRSVSRILVKNTDRRSVFRVDITDSVFSTRATRENITR